MPLSDAIGCLLLPPKVDMCGALPHVRFGPKADTCSAAKRNYSTTSSARASSSTVMPSAFAVLRLITSARTWSAPAPAYRLASRPLGCDRLSGTLRYPWDSNFQELSGGGALMAARVGSFSTRVRARRGHLGCKSLTIE